ncbi:CHAD domain-containing protein [Chitinilyticum piscinae]|uniref:CHAD domain-containing protein n=1 Tax=Chitinilyticum piscinae TaxID=2866724 RepID=A0A8J7FI93_9NEIS|nr:CHAD domain-containing protein [Chitinilyticum piscinae]MBE9609790.1 CHAD domain-containing protein [Chitinilyticum piscinae]
MQDRLQQVETQLVTEIARCRSRLLRNYDDEVLHELRVAIRTLRALLPLRQPKARDRALRRRWRQMAKLTDAARDLDVLADLLAGLQPQHPQLAALRSAAAREHRVVVAELSRRRWQGLLQATRQRPEQKKGTTSKRFVRRRQKLQRQLRRQLPRLSPASSSAAWHRLRLTIKRLRYLQEAGALLAQPPAPAGQLKKLQTLLGELHDLDNLQQQLDCDTGLATLISPRRAALLQNIADILPALPTLA